METTKKITKAQRFEDIIAMINGDEVKYGTTPMTAVDVLTHELELLAKKNQKRSEGKPEDDAMLEVVREYIQNHPEGCTCTDIFKSSDILPSSQKVTSLVLKLITSNEVIRKSEKGKTHIYPV